MSLWRGFGSDMTVAAVRRLRESPGLYPGVRADARARHRRQHRRVHAHRPRDAEAAARAAAIGAVPGRRHRRLLRELRPAGFLFAVLVRPLHAPARRRAAVQRTSRHSRRTRERSRSAARTTSTPPETLNGAFVSGNYFQLFELVPAAGRLIQPSDDQRGAAPVASSATAPGPQRFQARGRRCRQRGHPERRARDDRRRRAARILRRSAATRTRRRSGCRFRTSRSCSRPRGCSTRSPCTGCTSSAV